MTSIAASNRRFLSQSAQDFIEESCMTSITASNRRFLSQSAQDFIEEQRNVDAHRGASPIPEPISSGLH